MTSKGGTSCICRWCPSKTGHGISLFTLPRDPTRLRLWLQACNREDLLGKDANTLHKCYRICENHFEEKFLSKGGTRKTLFAEAMPTIFLHNITKVKSAVTNSHVYEKSSNKIVVTSEVQAVMKKKNGKCSVKNCINSSYARCSDTKVSYFRFPLDPERCRRWAAACGHLDALKASNPLTLYTSYRVCSIHFEERMFLNYLKNRLYPHAVPTLYLGDSHHSDLKSASVILPSYQHPVVAESESSACRDEKDTLASEEIVQPTADAAYPESEVQPVSQPAPNAIILDPAMSKLVLASLIQNSSSNITTSNFPVATQPVEDPLTLPNCSEEVIRIIKDEACGYNEHTTDSTTSEDKVQDRNQMGQEYRCRTCLDVADKASCMVVTQNCLSSLTIKEAIIQLVPQMASTLNDYQVVCSACLEILKSSMNFIRKCLEIEAMFEDYKKSTEEFCLEKNREDECKVEVKDDVVELVGREHDYYIKSELVDETSLRSNYKSLDTVGQVAVEALSSSPGKKLKSRRPKKYKKRLKYKPPEDKLMQYTCTTCSEKFTSRDEYRDHFQIHPPYVCDICGKAYQKKDSIKAHMDTHNDPNSFICEMCGMGFKARGTLVHHYNVHKTDRPIQCDKCSKQFKTNRRLRMHIQLVHLKLYKYQCNHCGVLFPSSANLKSHISVVHFKEKPFQCDICNKKFGRRDYLRNHMVTHGVGCLPVRKNKKPPTRVRRKLPKIIINEDGDGNPLPCKFCGKVIEDKAKLRSHVRTHIDRHECQFCNQTFTARSLLVKHESIHQKVDTYHRCNICYKKFKTKPELEQHAATQTHRRPPRYSCDICGQKFHRRFTLSQHKLAEHVGIAQVAEAEELVYDNLLEKGQKVETPEVKVSVLKINDDSLNQMS